MEDKDSEEQDIKFDPSTLLEANMSVDGEDNDENGNEQDVKNKSVDLFDDDEVVEDTDTPKSDDIDIIDSGPPNENEEEKIVAKIVAEPEILPPPPPNPPATEATNKTDLEESVDMDQAIEFMVSSSMDPFEAMPDVDEMLLQDLPL